MLKENLWPTAKPLFTWSLVAINSRVSGTTFERDEFQAAIALVEAGRVKNFVVKDMSRFGRAYLKVGFYTEVLFPDMDVRFIAISEKTSL